MNTTIKAAIVKIAIEQYIQGINEFPGYIDASDYFLEPTEVFDVEKYASIEDAEKEINQCVNVSINERDVIIQYEFIEDSETVYFNKVAVNGHVFSVDEKLYSEDGYEYIKNLLKNKDEIKAETLDSVDVEFNS